MVEAFGRSINKVETKGIIRAITIIENIPNITHQQYSDNTILPRVSTKDEAKNFKQIIYDYTKVSR